MSKEPKKIVIAAGGSGGHLYPATVLAKQLLRQNEVSDLLFVASGLDVNPFFDREQFLHRSISAATFTGRSPFSALKACKNIFRGYFQSRKILADYNPNLVIGFGSYHSFPLLLAARSLGVPIVLHEQNSKPGRVIRFFSKRALLTGVYFPSAIPQLRGKCVELAMPLRDGYRKEFGNKEIAKDYFGLDPLKMTLLVFGGSQGAQFINQTVSEALSKLSHRNECFQILHFTGNLQAVFPINALYHRAGIKAVVKKFEERMDLAWSIADLCIVRAGAGTIAEQLEYEVPGILIPYPHAADGHQDSNADYLVNIVGGGWKYRESDLNVEKLASICESFIGGQPVIKEKQTKMKQHRQRACLKEFATVINSILEEG